MGAFLSIALLALLFALFGNAMASPAERALAKRRVDLFAAKLTLWFSTVYIIVVMMIWEGFGAAYSLPLACLAGWMIGSRARLLYMKSKTIRRAEESS